MSWIGKSPITYLFERCLQEGLTPLFELENDLGPVHQREFAIKVTAGEYVGRGTGSSKKKAKHLAALEAVNQMMGFEIDSPESVEQEGSISLPNQNNPVGQLQELTQKKLLPLPTYEFEMTPGPPGVREFTCTIHLLKLTQTGVGKSKKLAKREAAIAMLDQLKVDDLADQLDEALKSLTDEFSIPQSDIRSAYQVLKEGKKPSIRGTPPGSYTITKPPKQVPTYCDLLQELADELKFEVTYVDLPEPTCAGLNQCIVQLSTMPVAVCHGCGRSVDESHASAALHTLLYLGIDPDVVI